MKKLFLIIFLFLSACATENPLKNMRFQPVSSGEYTLATWHKIKEMGSPLKVYIEGDGHAFDRKGRPTDDPTPKGLFLRKLAVDDSSPNVVYLARPCQYLMGKNCTQKDWTTGRFSSEIIDAMDSSVASLMKKARTQEVILIGYSGGGMIASQIAVRHPEQVKKLITIAAVLDKDMWTAYHGDEPLTDSINLDISKLSDINQVHYVGGKDKVVPADLTFNILGNDNANIKLIPKAKHGSGFDKIYEDIWNVR